MADPKVRADRTLAPALVKAFEAANDDDPRVRRYLALAIGRLDPPLPPDAVAGLTKALDDRPTANRAISAIWALGSSGDAAVVSDASAARTQSPDAGHPQDGGLRARRAAGRRADRRRCARRSQDADAGRPLERARSPWRARAATTASPVLRQMLDRAVRRAAGQARRARRTRIAIRLPTS